MRIYLEDESEAIRRSFHDTSDNKNKEQGIQVSKTGPGSSCDHSQRERND